MLLVNLVLCLRLRLQHLWPSLTESPRPGGFIGKCVSARKYDRQKSVLKMEYESMEYEWDESAPGNMVYMLYLEREILTWRGNRHGNFEAFAGPLSRTWK